MYWSFAARSSAALPSNAITPSRSMMNSASSLFAASARSMRKPDPLRTAACSATKNASRSWCVTMIELIKNHDSKPLALEIHRNGQPQSLTLTPRKIGDDIMIGATISPLELRTFEPGPYEAFKLSLKQNWEWSTLIFQTLGGLFTRETSVKQLMGPVAIADLSRTAAEQPTWIPIFQLMAMISLNLGLLNLMPIPVLDGGHIAILALEGISRRDFSMRVKEKMLLAGFVLLLMLMVTVIYNDLMRIQWIERLVPWR